MDDVDVLTGELREDGVEGAAVQTHDGAQRPGQRRKAVQLRHPGEDEQATFRSRYGETLRRAGERLLATGEYAEARARLSAAKELDADEALYRSLMTLEHRAGDAE